MGANVIDIATHNKVRRSISCYSLPSIGQQALNLNEHDGSDSFNLNTNEEEDEERKQMYEKLRARREALNDALEAKMNELKALCLREAEITGVLPPEMPRKPNEPLPTIRRRVRTEFELNDKLLTSPSRAEDEALAKLELEFEIQTKIVAAKMKLMNDVNVKKGIKKKRKEDYNLSKAKLDMLEKQLMPLRNELEETRKAKKSKRHLIQELNMKGCPIFDTNGDGNVLRIGNNNGYNNGVNGNGIKGVLTNSNGQQQAQQNLSSALSTAFNNGQHKMNKKKKQVRIKESNSTPSSPVLSRSTVQRERTMSGCVMDIRSSLRANDVQTGRHIVDGFGNSIHISSNGHQKFLSNERSSGLHTLDPRGKYDHLTREDIPNLNAINFVPMSPAKRRLMRTQAQRANNHSIDSGLRSTSAAKDILTTPLSKHGSIDNGIDTSNGDKCRHHSEHFGKVIPRNPPPPVPHPFKMAQRPLPPTPGHGIDVALNDYHNNEVFESPESQRIDTYQQQPDSLSSIDSANGHFAYPMTSTEIRLPDVTDGVHVGNNNLRRVVGGSSSSSIESDLMPPPPTLPPKVPKKSTQRPSPLTIPDSISSTFDGHLRQETISFTGSNGSSNRDSVSNQDSFSNRGSLAAESFLSLDMMVPTTPSFRSEVETPRPGPVPVTPTVNVPNADIVALGQFQPYWEETKPYELSDFYKYSAKHRNKQRQQSSSSLVTTSTVCESSIVNSQPVNGGNNGCNDVQNPSIETVTSPTSGFNTPAVSNDFCDEMLNWYDGQLKDPTVV